MKTALVLGAGGFIGSHLVKHLKGEGFWIRGVDLKKPEYWDTEANEFILSDLREQKTIKEILNIQFDEVYQLAADMGGVGYINTGKNDADIMTNSITINTNVLRQAKNVGIKKIFFSSSACVYPEHNQLSLKSINTREDSAYPANPDTEYGWEKLFSERLYLSYNKNYGMENKIARYHNIFGPYGTWIGGKEKAPAAICRKVAEADQYIELWGNGEQHRSFLYIEECIKATVCFYRQSNFNGPINIGSEKNISINELVDIVCKIAGKKIEKKYIPGPVGVNARTSNNVLANKVLGFKLDEDLEYGLSRTYDWIKNQIKNI